MKKVLLSLAFALMVLIPFAPAAKAQVVVRVGPEYHHRYYHRHYYHHAYYHHRYYYRHGHRYYR